MLLYTDGIIEARSADGEPFGLDRLIDFTVKAVADQLPLPKPSAGWSTPSSTIRTTGSSTTPLCC